MRTPWALSLVGNRPRTDENDDEALHAFLRGIVDELEDRFGVSVESASASGHDLLREPRGRSNADELEDAET